MVVVVSSLVYHKDATEVKLEPHGNGSQALVLLLEDNMKTNNSVIHIPCHNVLIMSLQ